MSSLRKTISFVATVTALAVLVFPLMSFAVVGGGGATGGGGGGGGGGGLPTTVTVPGANLATGTISQAIVGVINVLLSIVGIVAVIVLIYGGIRYIISLGDEKGAETAKHVILYAVIGLIVVGLSAVIVNFVLGAIRGTVQ